MPDPCRVLLVDDESEFLAVLQKRLIRRGLHVVGVGSGELAVEAAAAECFDVVVLDMKMPGMDGLETLRLLRRDHPETEVVMLTGHANTEAAVSGMDMGAFDYLIKPVELGELMDKVEDAHREGRLRRAGRATSPVPGGAGRTG